MSDSSSNAIFDAYAIHQHDFDAAPFVLSARQIKVATKDFNTTSEREVRILCKQDTREDRPTVFRERGLFLLPVRNGVYAIIKGEGYVNIPDINHTTHVYRSQLGFALDTVKAGDSEMQHLDFAYATSLVRTFLNDSTLVLTIRGRKFTPKFSFRVGKYTLEAESVQTEVDAGYEGKELVALIEAKNAESNNLIIRQLYYPFRQWSQHTAKPIVTLFFEKRQEAYWFWRFEFSDPKDYNSIQLVDSKKYQIVEEQPL